MAVNRCSACGLRNRAIDTRCSCGAALTPTAVAAPKREIKRGKALPQKCAYCGAERPPTTKSCPCGEEAFLLGNVDYQRSERAGGITYILLGTLSLLIGIASLLILRPWIALMIVGGGVSLIVRGNHQLTAARKALGTIRQREQALPRARVL